MAMLQDSLGTLRRVKLPGAAASAGPSISQLNVPLEQSFSHCRTLTGSGGGEVEQEQSTQASQPAWLTIMESPGCQASTPSPFCP